MRVLEVGAGRSVFVEIGDRFAPLLSNAIITDRSAAMVRHSTALGRRGLLVCADAEHLPFADNTLQLIIASLGDPYNTDAFWQQAARVLVAGGRCIFTSPAAEWSARFRSEMQFGLAGSALFETASGVTVAVQSIVRNTSDQLVLIEQTGLIVTDFSVFSLDMFPRQTALSPKIARFSGGATPIVCQFVARKPL
jgi:SAM-dependent methyltransferase